MKGKITGNVKIDVHKKKFDRERKIILRKRRIKRKDNRVCKEIVIIRKIHRTVNRMCMVFSLSKVVPPLEKFL